MNYWIFKYTEQKLYPDVHGQKYVFDNTHTVKVRGGDIFVYLYKGSDYCFTGAGCVSHLNEREPTEIELTRRTKIRTVFTAYLSDVVLFKTPLSISPVKETGKENRAKLGIKDANLLGWSQSMPRINEIWYEAIMDVAQAAHLIPALPPRTGDYSVPDKWAKTKIRQATSQFSDDVIERHCGRCVVCGTHMEGIVDAAHISSYAADEANRANPANGLCLCTYCHRALDRRLIAIQPNGKLRLAAHINDPIAITHFTAVGFETRAIWLKGVDPTFLQYTVDWFEDCQAKKQKTMR